MAASTERIDLLAAFVREVIPRLTPSDRLVLAASGGADSTAMVSLLVEAGLADAALCAVAHFDHRLRGEAASAGDRATVAALCERYRLQLIAGSWDDPRAGEAAARDARYAFLAGIARQQDAAVVTGHTGDDQAETVLLHALRGAGLHGLAGMAPDAPLPGARDVRLLRPMLCLSRAETRAWCGARGLGFADDPTNDDTSFARNRVRLQLLPALEHASPGARGALLRLAVDARRTLEAAASLAAPALLADRDDGAVWLSRDVLRAFPPEVAQVAWRTALVRLLGDAREFGRAHYETMAGAAEARTGATFTLPRGVVLSVDPGALALSVGPLGPPPLDSMFERALPFAGVAGAWSIDIRPAAAGHAAIALPAGAVLRARRPGDRVRPRGLGGTKKLQDWYTDQKVPRRERHAAPVIAAEGDVLWTPFGPCGDDGRRQGGPFVVRCERAVTPR
ncbi:MAG: tRNA lysidine(34) synthetase TilS [Dehalococcoidia bacterium]